MGRDNGICNPTMTGCPQVPHCCFFRSWLLGYFWTKHCCSCPDVTSSPLLSCPSPKTSQHFAAVKIGALVHLIPHYSHTKGPCAQASHTTAHFQALLALFVYSEAASSAPNSGVGVSRVQEKAICDSLVIVINVVRLKKPKLKKPPHLNLPVVVLLK